MPNAARPKETLTPPARTGVIVLTLVAALLLNLLPWQGTALVLRPDFAALTLLYWCVYQPRRVGMAAALLMGLLMDVADANLLGQHALAYVALSFAALLLHRRIQGFGAWQQALHVAVLLLLAQLVMLLVKQLSGGLTGWSALVPGLSGALLWPALLPLMQRLQRRKTQTFPE